MGLNLLFASSPPVGPARSGGAGRVGRGGFASAGRFILCLVLAAMLRVAAGATAAAAERPTLRDVLTPEEFHRAGLDKLTAEELRFLSDRLLRPSGQAARITPAEEEEEEEKGEDRTAIESTAPAETAGSPARSKEPATMATGEPASREAAFGREAETEARKERERAVVLNRITSRIPGRFRGWTGDTVFRLGNGQVWQQVDGRRFYVNLTDPVVTIEKGSFGAFYLAVEGYGSRAKVKRLR